MYIDEKESRRRQREAENARDNRAEIVKALSLGEISRRDLFRWGILSGSGFLAAKNGLNPFVKSAYAQVPTGVPRSPLNGIKKFTQELPRLDVQTPQDMTPDEFGNAQWSATPTEPAARRLSYHTEFTLTDGKDPRFVNPLTGKGPMEGRPPGEYFAHQRWSDYFPKQGYILTKSPCAPGTRFHPLMQPQNPNSVWCYGAGRATQGKAVPPLLKVCYGEPIVTRIYNNLPRNKSDNNGFGINQMSTHFHNSHNGAESDGACNAYHYPGTFYDYRWGLTLARRDREEHKLENDTEGIYRRASGPDGSGKLIPVAGDFRELQGSLWFHDHRFFYTAENVYKGDFGAINVYSGPDRGNERMQDDRVNHCLPSGWVHDYGNLDFDVNLIVHDLAYRQDGQLFFDIFSTDGFLGDIMCVNMAYAPVLKVLPRKYRFRLLNACMSRFVQLVLVDPNRNAVPFKFIANDGNFVVKPIDLKMLDEQGTGERYDIVVDFSTFKPGQIIQLVNLLKHKNGRKPDKRLSIGEALKGDSEDPAVGPLMQFIVSDTIVSVDDPGRIIHRSEPDRSKVPAVLTEQIPIVTPVRVRTIEFKHDALNRAKDCLPSCEDKDFLPWVIRVDGESTHSLNANRISLLIPKPGETEHWVVSTGGGWDHPIHLHFEEGITINRGGDAIPATEKLVRKDVWRLRPGGTVRFQVTFGEFGGSYVNHCHNTVHEDFAMLMRYQVLTNDDRPQLKIIPTPVPSENGVTYLTPEVLPEAYPKKRSS